MLEPIYARGLSIFGLMGPDRDQGNHLLDSQKVRATVRGMVRLSIVRLQKKMRINAGQSVRSVVCVALCCGFAIIMPPRLGFAAILDHASALPAVPTEQGTVHAALLVRDVRVLKQWHERRRATLRTLEIGRTLDDARAHGLIAGLWTELDRVLTLASGSSPHPSLHPTLAPVPAAIAWFTVGEASGFQVLIKTQPELRARLQHMMAHDPSTRWRGEVVGDGFAFDVHGHHWVGRIDANGWLRLAPDAAWLWEGGDGMAIPLSASLQNGAADGDVALVVREGAAIGKLWPRLTTALPGLTSLFERTGPMVSVWKTDGDKSSVVRVLLGVPELKELTRLMRPTALAEPFVRTWGIDAMTHGQINVHPALMRRLMQLVEAKAEVLGVPWADELTAAAETLDGRVGLLSFDAPSDWALVFGLRRGENAQQLVKALNGWLQQIASTLHVATPDQLSFTDKIAPQWPGSAQVHIRPQALLQGIRVVAAGSHVLVVSQKSRVPLMLHAMAHPRGSDRWLTPMVAETVDAPAVCTMYTVLGGDTTLGDWLTYAASGVRALTQAMVQQQTAEAQSGTQNGKPADTQTVTSQDKAGQPGFMADLLDSLPLLVAVANVRSLLAYDAAFSVDMREDGVVLQIAGSDL